MEAVSYTHLDVDHERSICTYYFSGAHAVDNGTMQVGNVMAFIQYAMQIIMSFLMITAMSIMLPRANVAALRIDAVSYTHLDVYKRQVLQ